MTHTECTDATDAPAATPEQISSLLDELAGSNLVGMLQSVQDRYGYLPAVVLREISKRTRTPLSRIYGVVSFYADFYTSPRGRHTVRACRGTACHVRGGTRLIQAIQKRLGIGEGETTEDMMFTFETVACLGACALSPVIVIDGAYYGKATPQLIEDALDRVLADESPREEDE